MPHVFEKRAVDGTRSKDLPGEKPRYQVNASARDPQRQIGPSII